MRLKKDCQNIKQIILRRWQRSTRNKKRSSYAWKLVHIAVRAFLTITFWSMSSYTWLAYSLGCDFLLIYRSLVLSSLCRYLHWQWCAVCPVLWQMSSLHTSLHVKNNAISQFEILVSFVDTRKNPAFTVCPLHWQTLSVFDNLLQCIVNGDACVGNPTLLYNELPLPFIFNVGPTCNVLCCALHNGMSVYCVWRSTYGTYCFKWSKLK